MSNFLNELHYLLTVFLTNSEFWYFYVMFFPFVILIEFPLFIMIFISALKVFWKETFIKPYDAPYYPDVSCIITCYNEGVDIGKTIITLAEQLYKGRIEVILLIDGADINSHTVNISKKLVAQYKKVPKRYFRVIPKSTRGGAVSSSNFGLKLAKGKIIVKLDGDCSCDNDFISSLVGNFLDENVVGVSGNIRVRNFKKNILTHLQALEYMFGIQLSKTGLGKMGILNNISGACGIFSKDFLNRIGGWRNGTAEDLDLTLRIKGYFKRYPKKKMKHEHHATIHTDVPETWKTLFKQRLRWDGDLFYLYFRRYTRLLNFRIYGFKLIFGVLWYDIFFCMVVPFSVVFYTIYLFVFYKPVFGISIFIMTYFYYLIWAFAVFIFYVLLSSNRKKKDLKLIVFIPLMPIYQFIMRIWTAVAIIMEGVLKTHKDSSMAPWWVIKKTH